MVVLSAKAVQHQCVRPCNAAQLSRNSLSELPFRLSPAAIGAYEQTPMQVGGAFLAAYLVWYINGPRERRLRADAQSARR